MSTISNDILYIRQNSTIQYSIDQNNWNNIIFPCFISSNNSLIKFISNINITQLSQYFIIKTNIGNLVIDGNNFTVNININNYKGLFQNGSLFSNGQNNVSLKNFIINSIYNNFSYNGWLCQQYYAKNATNNTITNCQSNGNISSYGGGLVGSYAGNILITNCITKGNISSLAGGIVGSYFTGTIKYCFSTGNIDNNAGGIAGSQANATNIMNCFSTGIISQNAGGILGSNSNNCIITDCYSIGNIGSSAGGITGILTSNCQISNSYSIANTIEDYGGGIVGASSNNFTVNNCYSVGSINIYAGGICGNLCDTFTINHCYTIGSIIEGGGGLYGADCSNPTITNSYYQANDVWDINNAINYLTGIFTVWFPLISEYPFLLASFNQNMFVNNSDTVIAGQNLLEQFNPLASPLWLSIFEYPNIYMNLDTGLIYTYNNTNPGTYNMFILNTNVDMDAVILYQYSFFYFSLTVLPPLFSNEIYLPLISLNGETKTITLNSNICTDQSLNINLLEGYTFDGNDHTIEINTSNILFNITQQDNSTKTIIKNLKVIGSYLIRNTKNIIISNCFLSKTNTPIGNNCENIEILNLKYQGIGNLIGDNCKNIVLKHVQIYNTLIFRKSSAILGNNCSKISIFNSSLETQIQANKCNLISDDDNNEIDINNLSIKIKLAKKYKFYLINKKSHNLNLNNTHYHIIN